MSAATDYRRVVEAVQAAVRHVPQDDTETRLKLSLALVSAKSLANIEPCPCCGAETAAADLWDISSDGPAQLVCLVCADRLIDWQVLKGVKTVTCDDTTSPVPF